MSTWIPKPGSGIEVIAFSDIVTGTGYIGSLQWVDGDGVEIEW